MTNRRRLIFWGPGHIGGAALREVLTKHTDQYEVVGARVYSSDKNGRDVGELVGLEPIGVRATTDTDAILALEADCVVFTPQPIDPGQVAADAIALLRSGKNVVSPTTFHNPLVQTPDHADALEAACQAGNATLHGTGVHPSFIVERLATTLTGLFTDVRHIRVVEAVDSTSALADMAPEFVAAIGFGQPLPSLSAEAPGAAITNHYYHPVIAHLAEELYGASFDEVRIEQAHYGFAAEREHAFPKFTIAEGSAGTIVHEHRAYIGYHHFYTNEEYWYLGAEQRTVGEQGPPFGPYNGDSNYVVQVTGDPYDLTLQLDLEDTRHDNIPVTTYATLVPILQSIDMVVDAPSGILFTHAAPHFRAKTGRADLAKAVASA